MSNELTPLEALNKLMFDKSLDNIPSIEEEIEMFGIVENALKEKEQLQVFETVFCLEYKNHKDLEEHFRKIEKKLKALEIIKNRECLFKGLQDVSQEEYDLLKEVLL